MVVSLPSKWETGVRIQVMSYQRQLKWYLMLPNALHCIQHEPTGGSSLQQPDGPLMCDLGYHFFLSLV